MPGTRCTYMQGKLKNTLSLSLFFFCPNGSDLQGTRGNIMRPKVPGCTGCRRLCLRSRSKLYILSDTFQGNIHCMILYYSRIHLDQRVALLEVLRQSREPGT